jgi:hypothetical protein
MRWKCDANAVEIWWKYLKIKKGTQTLRVLETRRVFPAKNKPDRAQSTCQVLEILLN